MTRLNTIDALPESGPTRRGLFAGAAAAAATLGACQAPDRAPPETAPDGRDPRFPELSDQRSKIEPIRPDERAARRALLGRLLGERGLDAYFCEGGPTLSYLTGVGWGHSERVFGLLVLADGSSLWICPGFEATKAQLKLSVSQAPGELLTWEEDGYARHAFAGARGRGIERVALDPSTRLLVREEALAGGYAERELVSGRELLVALRGVKDARELALLRRANELTQQAIEAASTRIELGMGNAEIADLMRGAQAALGLTGIWVLALIGPSAAYPHGDDGKARLGAGDFLLVDTGGALHGYQSDNTRTWVPHGEPSLKQLLVWNTVREAQRAAFEAIRPGATCASIDLAARAVIDRAGFGPDYRSFTHRLGHGIGLQGHEDPYFDRGSRVVLQPGMTLSNEPGIYLHGEFGVRLEDIVAVTETGADHFGHWQADPRSPVGAAPVEAAPVSATGGAR